MAQHLQPRNARRPTFLSSFIGVDFIAFLQQPIGSRTVYETDDAGRLSRALSGHAHRHKRGILYRTFTGVFPSTYMPEVKVYLEVTLTEYEPGKRGPKRKGLHK